jgi:hypothetical protein
MQRDSNLDTDEVEESPRLDQMAMDEDMESGRAERHDEMDVDDSEVPRDLEDVAGAANSTLGKEKTARTTRASRNRRLEPESYAAQPPVTPGSSQRSRKRRRTEVSIPAIASSASDASDSDETASESNTGKEGNLSHVDLYVSPWEPTPLESVSLFHFVESTRRRLVS